MVNNDTAVGLSKESTENSWKAYFYAFGEMDKARNSWQTVIVGSFSPTER
jgi:hypothetical protein